MAMDHLGYIWRNMQLEEPDSKLVAKNLEFSQEDEVVCDPEDRRLMTALHWK
jgi:hypothetical protein